MGPQLNILIGSEVLSNHSRIQRPIRKRTDIAKAIYGTNSKGP